MSLVWGVGPGHTGFKKLPWGYVQSSLRLGQWPQVDSWALAPGTL